MENPPMTILEPNPIPQLIARHRRLKAQRDALDKELKSVKAELMPAVEQAGGKWEDDTGYARIVERRGSVNYPNDAVHNYATIWSQSGDPVMQSCGEMLTGVAKSKNGYSYLQVK
jgi:hypothetical protein